MLRAAVVVSIATLVMMLAASGFLITRHTERPFDRLRDADGERAIEARLSRFRWARFHSSRPTPQQNALAKRILTTTAETRQWREDAAASALVINDPDRAIVVITEGNEATRDASLWSDLAAAYLTRAQERRSMEDVVEAIAATEAALDLDPHLAEAQFNRALTIERLGLREQAAFAWSEYVRNQPADGWSNEARSHLAALTASTRSFDEAAQSQLADLAAGNDRAAAQLVATYPAETRNRLLTTMLTELTQDPSDASARQHLAVTRSLARELASRGDPFIADYVAQIEAADPDQQRTLARAQALFAEGRRLKDTEPTAAEELFRESERLFAQTWKPMSLLARRHAATCLYNENRIDDARRELRAVLAEIDRRYRTERAEALWQLALCHSARTNWGASIDALSESLALFEQVGDVYDAAVIRHMLAEVHDEIGDADTGDKLRMEALPVLGRSASVRTQTCLSSISRQAAVRKRWRASAAILDLEIDLARRLSDPPSHADALLRRAVARHFLGRADAARADLQAAGAVIAAMKDEAYRVRAHADALMVESLLATSPNDAVRKLTTAIDFHEADGRRMYLPSLYLQRGRALRDAGDRPRAMRDFETGIRVLERSRQTLPDIATRLGIFDAAEDLFTEVITDALQRGDARGALALVERARARTLLDSMTATPASDLDSSTALVELFTISQRVVGFVVTSDSINTYDVPTPAEELTRLAGLLRSSLVAGRAEAAKGSARQIYDALVAPVAMQIDRKERLVFVSDQSTAAIPFGALVDHRGRYLIQDHTVIASPSAAVFLRLRRKANGSAPRRALLVVAPATDTEHPLPAVESERRAIVQVYPTTSVMDSANANAEAFFQMAPRADAIHFAGHSIASNSAGASPSLVLGGSAEISRADVEKLVLPHTKVVVLAACDTARGDVSWTEGSLSMARAFLAAGAPSVIATVSRIPDDEAADFFPRLHRRLAAGVAPAVALRDTQREWLQRRPESTLWASVEIIGQ